MKSVEAQSGRAPGRRRWKHCAIAREGAPGDRLEQCNAILSMVLGGEYPLAGIRRDRAQKARDEPSSLFRCSMMW
jgi:hypothetical protein